MWRLSAELWLRSELGCALVVQGWNAHGYRIGLAPSPCLFPAKNGERLPLEWGGRRRRRQVGPLATC